MTNKKYNTATLENELAGASLFFQKKVPQKAEKAASKVTPKSTRPRGSTRRNPRELSRRQPHEDSALPTRNEIQEFSFKLRDELKVKVQAEVPPAWQKELDDMAHDLGVKKLELYRYILGEFLGKVKRQSPN